MAFNNDKVSGNIEFEGSSTKEFEGSGSEEFKGSDSEEFEESSIKESEDGKSVIISYLFVVILYNSTNYILNLNNEAGLLCIMVMVAFWAIPLKIFSSFTSVTPIVFAV
ncbi:hypothetical protein RhiirA5_370609 [Rhizophagus irregularis]|uniref:Uncharacterized protein n=1 Tax=Rhizophagus irregularis TaxID=588596 RepID=A0A2N0Q8W0_9GLOM|nr:hypothetical protein RhiirA5_370609 [Rhizophagus irregularis]